ncbi:MAG: alpha/beta hydrolase fold domain-containing protein [Betaproteobacteria bacterium]
MEALGAGSLALCLMAAPAVAGSELPAFPGAEGFGASTPGGRAGRAVLVTSLEDSGPGSFRAAVAAKGPRTVVFRVGGLVTLRSRVVIEEPFLTIAGQTAPGDGICFRGQAVEIRTHDVVVRHLRFRPGDVSGAEVDGLSLGGGARRVILDHCSAGWSVDESLSLAGDAADVTVQWCLIAEALNRSVHRKGPHGYGSLMRASGGVTLHHDLWAHNVARNPRLGDDYGRPPWPLFDVRNNVIYDYGAMASGLTGDHLRANYVANYVRPGPASDTRRGVVVLTPDADVGFHVTGNLAEGRPDVSADNTLLFERGNAGGRRRLALFEEPFAAPPVRTTDAVQSLQEVLTDVGATRPRRDPVDARVLREVQARGGRTIDSQQDVGGWPVYASGTAPADADADGMPDEWERAHGLDPADLADGPRLSRDGYTNLEVYLNELAGDPPAPAEGRVIPIWPEGVPDAKPGGGEERIEDGRVYNVQLPTLTFFPAPAAIATGAAVIVCPGGGYARLAVAKEGTQLTRRLTALGVSAFVLKYRLAEYGHPAPLRDVLRALRLVRSRAAELGVRPDRIGVLGSSAGGHLAAAAGTLFAAPEGRTGAALDSVSARPDFVALLYPVITMRDPHAHAGSRRNLLGESPLPALVQRLSLETQVTRDTPPVFIVHTAEDRSVPVENSLLFYEALRQAGVPVEMHLYEKGPHGFGTATGLGPTSEWPLRFEEWLRSHGWLEAAR